MTITKEGDGAVDDANEDGLPEFFGEESGADPFEELEAAEAEEPDSADAEGAADAPADAAGRTPKTVPYDRLKKVIAERNAARERLSEREAVESELRAKLSGHEAFRETVAQRYGRFRNPAAQLAHDSDFLSAMEEMAKSDPDVKKFYAKVMTSMNEPGSNNQQQPQQREPVQPAKDARLDRIVERQARVTIAEVLQPLKLQPKYQKLIETHVVQNAKDLAELDGAAVKKLTRGWIEESGFTVAEMRQAKAGADAPTPKPPTGRQNAPAAGPRKAVKKADPKTFENREAFLQSRGQQITDLIEELFPSAGA